MAGVLHARRAVLPDPQSHENAGLVADRWLARHDDGKESARKLIETVSSSSVSEAYRLAFDRWSRIVSGNMPGAIVLKATLRGPLAIGLGVGSPLENGFAIRRPYGIPYLPGSGIKGMCRRGALQLKESGGMNDRQSLTLFGATENDATQGIATFHDAWLDPEAENRPFQLDTITVHHQDYYSSTGAKAPTDFDEPVPVPFLVVRPGVSFRIVVEMDPAFTDAGWGSFVSGMVTWGFGHLGIGGKTNAGYGLCDVVVERLSPSSQTQGTTRGGGFDVSENLAGIKGVQDLTKIDEILKRVSELPVGERRVGAELVKAKLVALKWWIPKNADKARYLKVEELLGE
jgi:CRISPR-associated protein Cmr6